MITIATDFNNDIYLDKRDLAIATNAEATGMVVASMIRTLKGEIPLNTDKGIAWMELMSGSNPDLNLLQFYLMATAKREKTVSGIDSIYFSLKDGVLAFTMTIKTTDGEEVTING